MTNIVSEYINDNFKKRVFEAAYIIFLFVTIMSYSLYGYMDTLQPVFSLLRKTSFLLIMLKLLMDLCTHEFSVRELIFIGIVGCVFLLSAYITGNRGLLVYWAFIVGAGNYDYRSIIRISLIVHLIALAITVLSCYAGIIDNIIYYRDLGALTGVRESLGFLFTTESTNMFFYTALMWIYYRREQIHPAEWLIIAAIIIFLYLKTDTKNATAWGFIALAGSVVLKYSSKLRTYHSWYTVVGVMIVPLLAAFIIAVSYNYDGGIAWMASLNEIINQRLVLAKSGFDTYGIKLFGQFIIWNGGAQWTEVYNYVDSSYVQILLNFGPIVFGLIIAGAIALGVRIGQKKDSYLLLVIVMIAIHSTFDPQLVWAGYNSFVMAYSYFKLRDSGILTKEQASSV